MNTAPPAAMQPVQMPLGYAIHRLGATFVDRALEREFRRAQMQAQRGFFIYFAALMLLFNIASLLFDATQKPQALANPWMLGVRLASPASTLWLLVQAIWHAQSPRFGWVVETFVVLTIGLIVMVLSLHADYAFIGPVIMICTLFGLYLLLPFHFYRQIFYTSTFTVLGSTALMVNPVIDTNLFRLAQWLVFVHGIGLFTSWQRHLTQRQLYATGLKIRAQLDKETAANRHNRALVDLLTHELRNPLANIGVQADLIQRIGDVVASRHAQHIVESVQQADALIRRWIEGDRLALSASDRPAPSIETPASGIDLLPQIGLNVQQIQLRHPQLCISLDDRFHAPGVRIDTRVFNLVLLNIIDNAAKYAGVDTHGQTRITIGLRHRSGRVWVRVRDFGPGIGYDQQDRIFVKHQRLTQGTPASRDPGGTGIGLYLCQALLNLQNARLTLRSKPGLGCAFVIDMAQV
ncbi:MAG: sensor histidine kinase [Rhodoferax sp.]